LRFLPHRPWLGLLLSWSAVIWVAIVLLLAMASINRPPPCNPIGAGNPDPALPTCGIDDFSIEGIMAFLLFVVWVGGIVLEAVVFAISRLVKWLRPGSQSSSEQ